MSVEGFLPPRCHCPYISFVTDDICFNICTFIQPKLDRCFTFPLSLLQWKVGSGKNWGIKEFKHPRGYAAEWQKCVKHYFSEHTPFLFDLSLKDIQASAQTLITLVKVPDCPCVPANIREFSQIGTAGCMCYLYGVTAGKVKQLSQGHSNTVNESLFHSYIEDRQIKICVYAWFSNARNSFLNNVKLSSLITLN